MYKVHSAFAFMKVQECEVESAMALYTERLQSQVFLAFLMMTTNCLKEEQETSTL